MTSTNKDGDQPGLSGAAGSPWFCTSHAVCREFFIIGDPRKSGEAFEFCRDTQTCDVTACVMHGVCDDYTRVSAIPKWVRAPMLKLLLANPASEPR